MPPVTSASEKTVKYQLYLGMGSVNLEKQKNIRDEQEQLQAEKDGKAGIYGYNKDGNTTLNSSGFRLEINEKPLSLELKTINLELEHAGYRPYLSRDNGEKFKPFELVLNYHGVELPKSYTEDKLSLKKEAQGMTPEAYVKKQKAAGEEYPEAFEIVQKSNKLAYLMTIDENDNKIYPIDLDGDYQPDMNIHVPKQPQKK